MGLFIWPNPGAGIGWRTATIGRWAFGPFFVLSQEIEGIGVRPLFQGKRGLTPVLDRQMTKEDLIELLEPTVNAMGYELIDLDLRSGRGGLVRLFIDKDPAVTLSDCEHVSRQVSDLLDVEDPLLGGYVLEVSSPGLDRRLRTPEHFASAVGVEIRVELRSAVDGRRKFRGHLTAANATGIEIDGEGTKWQLPLAEVTMARLVPTD